MKLKWKESFKEKSNGRLLEIFSTKKRINIDPQIFAGNLLFDRNFDLETLKSIKKELIKSIEEDFIRKYNTDPKKIKRENLIREIILRTLLAIFVFGIFYYSKPMTFKLFNLNIDNKTIAVILGLFNFIPLFWLKKSHEKAIKKVEKDKEKKNNLIKKLNRELKY